MPTTSDERVSFNDAWNEIASNLNSNPGHDLAYLTDRAHAWYESKAPIRSNMMNACWEQMLSILTSMASESVQLSDYEIQEFFHENYEMMSRNFEEAEISIRNNDIGPALEKASKAIAQIEELTGKGLFIDNDQFAYRSFMTPLEGMVWRAHSKDTRDLIPCPFPFDLAYFYHALASCALGRYEEAESDLHKAIHWNPANADLWFELGDNYRKIGQPDEFGQCVYSAYPYALNVKSLARYHRDCGYYLAESDEIDMAAAHLHVAIALDANHAAPAWQELGYILEKHGVNLMAMGYEEAVRILQQRSEPILGDPMSVAALVGLLNQALSIGDLKTAMMSSSSLYEMTNDENMKNVFMAIMMAINNNQQIVVSEN